MNKINGILVLLLYICVGTALLRERFVGVDNMQNILRWTAEFGIIGIGVAFVIITGGIDLSIGSFIGFIGCVMAVSLTEWGVPVAVTLMVVMLLSIVTGLFHGLLVTRLKLQPFIVTLCGLLYFRGLSRWVAEDKPIGFGTEYNETLRLLALGKPCSIALLGLVVGVAVLATCAWLQWKRGVDNGTGLRIAGGLTGLALVAIGAARYGHGWEFVAGPPLFSLGSLAVPTWNVVVPEAGAQLPQQILLWSGWVVVPGLLWLVTTMVLSGRWLRLIISLLALAAGAGLVRWSLLLVHARNDWFWPSAEWADIWRIVAVFGTLGCLMALVGWFIRSAHDVTDGRAGGPLLLTGAAMVFWLLGQTPLGAMLVPAPMIMMIVLGIVAAVFLNLTIYGRYLLALGSNEEAARYSGINTQGMIVLSYLLCSLAAGIGGILFALDLNSIQPQGHGNVYELFAIAAAVLGGCSLRGGEGTILGVVVGTAVIQVLRNSCSLLGYDRLEYVIIGLALLLGVIVDEARKRMAARRKAIAEGEALLNPPSIQPARTATERVLL